MCALGLKALKLLLISLLHYTFVEYVILCGSIVCSVFEIEKIDFSFGSDFFIFILISVFLNQLTRNLLCQLELPYVVFSSHECS